MVTIAENEISPNLEAIEAIKEYISEFRECIKNNDNNQALVCIVNGGRHYVEYALQLIKDSDGGKNTPAYHKDNFLLIQEFEDILNTFGAYPIP